MYMDANIYSHLHLHAVKVYAGCFVYPIPDKAALKHTCASVSDVGVQGSSWHAHEGVAGLLK